MPIKAVVTGHSRGLGAALADELRSRGVEVLGVSRKSLPDAGGSTTGRDGRAALQEVSLDLADTSRLVAWCEGPTLAEFLEGAEMVLLVNNAGVVQPIGPIGSQTPELVMRAVALNVAAPLLISGAVLRAAPLAREHRIVHVSSGAARNPYAGWSVYCATKAALDQHVRAMVLDAVPGLRVCSLAPGVVDTDMQGELRATPEQRFPMRGRFESLKAEGQLSSPVDAARQFVEHLLSDSFGTVPVADLRSRGGA